MFYLVLLHHVESCLELSRPRSTADQPLGLQVSRRPVANEADQCLEQQKVETWKDRKSIQGMDSWIFHDIPVWVPTTEDGLGRWARTAKSLYEMGGKRL